MTTTTTRRAGIERARPSRSTEWEACTLLGRERRGEKTVLS